MKRVVVLMCAVVGVAVGCTPTSTPPPSSTAPAANRSVVVTNPARVELVGNGAWQALPGSSLTVDASAGEVVDVDFWASSSCTGPGRRYARVVLDGAEMASAPLTSLPAASGTTEQSASVRSSSPLDAGPHQVGVEVRIDPGTTCVVVAKYWHLRADLIG